MESRKRVRIISLGEIVTPDIMNAIRAFTTLIAEKKKETDYSMIGKLIGKVLQQNKELIDDFKLGKINENDFTQLMIEALEKATEVRLSAIEFDTAWNAMNPRFEQFADLLSQAINYNNEADQEIVFISFTNPKDMQHLIRELEANKQSYLVEGDQLLGISGISLFTTYQTKKNKAELIETIIKELKHPEAAQGVLASSMSNLFKSKQSSRESMDVKYVHSSNEISEPTLKEDWDNVNQEVEARAGKFSVDTIIWLKKKETLADALNNSQKPIYQMVAASL